MTPPPPAGRHDPYAPFRGSCRSCPAAVLWAYTTTEERMPVNEKPTVRGNVVLTIQEATRKKPARLLAGVLSKGQAAGAKDRGVQLYQSHFVDCPNADGHRRTRSRR